MRFLGGYGHRQRHSSDKPFERPKEQAITGADPQRPLTPMKAVNNGLPNKEKPKEMEKASWSPPRGRVRDGSVRGLPDLYRAAPFFGLVSDSGHFIQGLATSGCSQQETNERGSASPQK
jgi:hypothetical protein